MKISRVLMLVALVFVLQGILVRLGLPFGITPNLIIVFTVFLVLRYEKAEGAVFAIVSSLLLDLYLSKAIGITVLSMLVVVVVLYFIKEAIVGESLIMFSVLLILSTFIHHFIADSLMTFLRMTNVSPGLMIRTFMFEVAYSMIALYILLFIARDKSDRYGF